MKRWRVGAVLAGAVLLAGCSPHSHNEHLFWGGLFVAIGLLLGLGIALGAK